MPRTHLALLALALAACNVERTTSDRQELVQVEGPGADGGVATSGPKDQTAVSADIPSGLQGLVEPRMGDTGLDEPHLENGLQGRDPALEPGRNDDLENKDEDAGIYSGDLVGLNGQPVEGRIAVTSHGEILLGHLHASGLSPGSPHRVLLQGFAGGGAARCPNAAADADSNGRFDPGEVGDVAGDPIAELGPSPIIDHDGWFDAELTGQVANEPRLSAETIVIYGGLVGMPQVWDPNLPAACAQLAARGHDNNGQEPYAGWVPSYGVHLHHGVGDPPEQ